MILYRRRGTVTHVGSFHVNTKTNNPHAVDLGNHVQPQVPGKTSDVVLLNILGADLWKQSRSAKQPDNHETTEICSVTVMKCQVQGN